MPDGYHKIHPQEMFLSLTDCIKLQTEWEGKTNNTNTGNSKNSISALEMN